MTRAQHLLLSEYFHTCRTMLSIDVLGVGDIITHFTDKGDGGQTGDLLEVTHSVRRSWDPIPRTADFKAFCTRWAWISLGIFPVFFKARRAASIVGGAPHPPRQGSLASGKALIKPRACSRPKAGQARWEGKLYASLRTSCCVPTKRDFQKQKAFYLNDRCDFRAMPHFETLKTFEWKWCVHNNFGIDNIISKWNPCFGT